MKSKNRSLTHSACDISIFGLGYVGLCMAVCFAHKGLKVTGVEVDPEKIEAINKGKSPIYEPLLDGLLKASIKSKALCCTSDYEHATRASDISFITVGTPTQTSGALDLRYVRSSSKNIGKALRRKQDYHLVVVRSTVLPGTTQNIVRPLIEKHSGKKCGSTFDLCYNPEFLRQGSAIADILNPDRIIIGECTERSGDYLENFYRGFHARKTPPIIRSSPSNAEMIKLANNAFLATKITFANTVAGICETLPDTDVTVVAKAIGLDRRIGSQFLNAGLGYGGSCLPKDLRGLRYVSKRLRTEPLLLKAVESVNNAQPLKVVEMAKTLLGSLQGKRVAILGLAFKPNTDDVRDSASIRAAKKFADEKAKVTVYDPMAMENAKKLLNDEVQYASSPGECINRADCCIIATEWPEFKTLKSEDYIRHMKTPILIDARRIYDADAYRSKLTFSAIGLGKRT